MEEKSTVKRKTKYKFDRDIVVDETPETEVEVKRKSKYKFDRDIVIGEDLGSEEIKVADVKSFRETLDDDNDDDISDIFNSVNTEEEVKEEKVEKSKKEPVKVEKKQVDDDFGDEKSSNGVYLAIIFVLIVVIILLLLKGCNDNKRFTIKFNTQGGTEILDQEINKNGRAVEPKTPTREGYNFVGWYIDDTEYDFKSKVNKNITIVAKWDKIEDFSVKGVSLDQSEVTIKVGSTLQLNAVIDPDNAKEKAVTWSSSDNKVVSVDENGLIKGLKVGTATIKVVTKEGNFEATCKVIVSKDIVKVTGITLNKTSATVAVNDTITLVATVKPKNASNKGVKWTSSDTKIATVDNNGKVKGIKDGKVTITAETKDGAFTATATITVKTVKVTGVTLNTNAKELYVGDTYTLKATVKPADASNKGISWSSSANKVATVDANGKVKALKEGTTIITVTTKDGNYKAKATITVKPSQVTKVTISGSKTVTVGSTITLKATVTANGTANKTVTWTSSKTDVATISSNGVVKGIKAGTTTITATAGGKSATYTVTVTPKGVKLTIEFTALCATGNSTIQGYSYVVKNNGNTFNDYKGIKIDGTSVAKGGKISASFKPGKHNFIIFTNNNGEVTISGTLPSSC